MSYECNKKALEENGFSILANLYSEAEVNQIIDCITTAEQKKNTFQKTADLFAIRQLITHIPKLPNLLFSKKLIALLSHLFDAEYFMTKAIYFDKPHESNWFVPYHQDLSISVNQKADLANYTNWTFKKEQHGVQPPLRFLQNTVTIRIHLDKTDENNGALKVIPKSHLHGIIRSDSEQWNTKDEYICKVEKGGVMLMKPLTLHASNRTTNGKRRRVIHLEFHNEQLTAPLAWLEYFEPKQETSGKKSTQKISF